MAREQKEVWFSRLHWMQRHIKRFHSAFDSSLDFALHCQIYYTAAKSIFHIFIKAAFLDVLLPFRQNQTSKRT